MTASPVERTRPLRELVAEEIRALLARRRMNGVQLALRIGRSQSYVSRRLTGETAFDTDDLERIAEVLGVNIIDLMPRPRTRPDLPRWDSLTYPHAAGGTPNPITRGPTTPPRGAPPTFGHHSGARKINTRPPGHPTSALRRVA